MRIYKPLAALAAASLCATGLGAGAAAAAAAEDPAATSFVRLKDFNNPRLADWEAEVYDTWHFDPDHQATGGEVDQARNGIVFAAGADVLAMKGNGLDDDEAVSSSATDIRDLAESLDIVASSTSGLSYQVPVFYDKADGSTGYTALFKTLSSEGDTWTTTSAIGADFAKNASASLGALTDALERFDNARPIGAGFLSQGSSTDVIVSSFTAGGETSKFYAQPAAAAAGEASSEYLSDGFIRPDEDEYVGWHNGDASGRSYHTADGEEVGETLGLEITGKTQILNGLADDDFVQNAASRARDMKIDIAEGEAWAQVAVFAYPEGVNARVFTTLRAEVPSSGDLGDAVAWQSSKDIPGPNGAIAIAKDADATLDAIVAALGDHEVIGYGAFVDTGETAIIRSIGFDGTITNFAKKFGESSENVMVSEFAHPEDDAQEHEVYNTWHFAPDQPGTGVVQALDGMRIANDATTKVQAIKGNGNDAEGTVSQDESDISDLAESLAIDATDRSDLFYQIAVRWDGGWSTLRKQVDGALWTTSKKIDADLGANAVAPLGELTDAIERQGNAYAIGAGFYADYRADTVVRSFTAAGETTTFAGEPARTSVSFSVKPVYNSAATATVRVSAPGTEGTPTGSVKLSIAGRSFTAALKNGTASVKLDRLINAGTYKTTVVFKSDAELAFQDSARSANVTVKKATPSIALKLSKSKVKTSQKAKAAVTVKIPGTLKATTSKFRVIVYDGKKRIKSATLSSSGRVSVTLPKLKKGTHKIKATVSTTSKTNAKSSTAKTLKVVK